MIKAIIFDMGGVLVKSGNDCSYNRIAEKYGITLEAVKSELISKLADVQTGALSEKQWIGDFLRKHGIEPPEDYEMVWAERRDESIYDQNMFGLLRTLRKNGYKLALLSNTEPLRMMDHKKRGITDFFDIMVFSCEVGMRKSDDIESISNENIYHLTVEKLGLKPSECVMIDNRIECVNGSNESGLIGVHFQRYELLKKQLVEINVNIDNEE